MLDLHLMQQNVSVFGQFDLTGAPDAPNLKGFEITS
jgi:hypothetical protein